MASLAELDLDPGVRSWIARLEEIAPTIPGLTDRDPAVQRLAAHELSDALAVDFTLPIPEGVDIEWVTLGDPRARRYRPAGVDESLPTRLWLHGGGFYAGTPDEALNDRLLARRALESGPQIFSLDYRLAPEHPYPAPIIDAVRALDDLVHRADTLGVDAERIGIGGNSAGAAISASTALRFRDVGDHRLIHVDLEVPPTATRAVGPSAIDYLTGFGLDQIDHIMTLYIGAAGPADENISPLDVADLSDLPPHLIFVAEHDLLRDAGLQYAVRCRQAEVEVARLFGHGHLHGIPGLTATFPGAHACNRTIPEDSGSLTFGNIPAITKR